MLRKLLGFELSLHTRQIGFWIAMLAMVAVGLLFSSHEDFSIGVAGGQKVKVNGAIPIAITLSAFSLFSIFFAAVFTVTGVMRDDTHKSVEVVHSTPVTTRDMLVSRMLGVWIATTLCLGGLFLGTVIGPFMPWGDAEVFQSFNLLHYVQPFFLFCVLNALLVSAIYTLIAVTTRNRTLVYVSAVGLLVLYLLGSAVAGEDPAEWVSAIADPFGTTALAVQTQFWPAAEQNANMAPVSGWVGFNRLFYTVVGIGLFALSFVLSTRGIATRRTRSRTDDTPPPAAARVAPVTPSLGAGFTLSAFWARLRFEYLSTVRSAAFMILVGIALTLFAFSLIVVVFFGASTTLPTSTFMTQVALGSLFLPMMIIMVFFGSDIMWRDRTANMHGILDATPVRSVSLLFAKWGALALMLLTLVIGLLLAGMVAQAVVAAGRTDVSPMTFLSIGTVNFYVQFFLLGMLVMFIQNFMPSRIIGMLVAAGVLIALDFGLGRLPFYHPLMNFGSVGAGSYSEMGGFSAPQSFGWEFAYWMGLILILGALSVWVWRRGMQAGLGYRLATIGKRLSLPSLATAVAGAAMFAGFGYAGLKSYQAGDYQNREQREASQADYERLVGERWMDLEPRITAVSVDADIFPGTRTATFRGRYTIDNPHDRALERTTVTSGVGVDNIVSLDIQGAERVTGTDFADRLADDFDVLEYRFDPPLAPGERRTVAFETRFNAPTLTEGSSIARNGTFVNNSDALIIFGNLEAGFHTNPDTRRQQGLPERLQWPERDDQAARRYNLLTSFSGFADHVDFDARICTDEGQIPVAPGAFQGETIEDGRVCRSYASINPIANFFSFQSAAYEVRTDVWENPAGEDIKLEIYFHPEHDYNVDIMFAAMKTALSTFTEEFSPYQYAQLRIMEFPFNSFAQAFAGTVPFAENIGFIQDPGDAEDPKRVDFATYVTMHEIGHQWFAHQVVGAFAKGSNLLSEGLTENATMVAYERHYDFEKARRMHEERSTMQYLTSRTFERDDEPILAEAEDQGYLNYQKTSWVMWGMRGIMGDEAVQRSVRRFLTEHHVSKGAPYPTTLELLDSFRREIDRQYHPLLEDYWNKITFWDLGFSDDPVVTADGTRFTVTLPVTVDKLYASEEDGEETSVTEIDGASLDEWVVIGFYDEDPKDTLGAYPKHVETVRLSEAETSLDVSMDFRPTHVVLDPHRFLIERNVKDNVKALDAAASGSVGN